MRRDQLRGASCFGEIVRSHRRRLGLSQEELAAKIGVSVRAIGRIENDRTVAPRPFTLRVLADAFELSGSDRDRFFDSAREDPAGGAAPTPPAPAQLPAAAPGFVGRDDHLRRLDDLRERAELACVAPAIAAIVGTAGVGKTTLALHWSHLSRDRFPDGQLYANLRGFDPSANATSPADALRGFLDALGTPPSRVPSTLDAMAALYRSLLARRRILVVLDNARDPEQVRPLLPGAPGCLVLVTSRDQLSGLVTRDGAQPLSVDVVSVTEAHELLARRLGTGRLALEPTAVSEIIARTARLPLALAIVAARAATYPDLPLRSLAAELADGGGGLDALGGADPSSDIRTVFSWSYGALPPAAARLFRLLGLHPGPTISLAAAASLFGEPLAGVRRLLADLVRAHLVDAVEPGRYGLHDLLRAYAIEQAELAESPDERRMAEHRMFDHYAHSGFAAAVALEPRRHRLVRTEPLPGVSLEPAVDHDAALAWFDREYPFLRTAPEHCVRRGFDAHAWQLAWILVPYADRKGYWDDWIANDTAAVDAARRQGNTRAEAAARGGLARVMLMGDRADEALEQLERTSALRAELDDGIGLGWVQMTLADLAQRQGRFEDGLVHVRAAFEWYRSVDDLPGQATAATNLGWILTCTGEHRQAIDAAERALAAHGQLGDVQGQAAAWHTLGCAHHHLGHGDEAIECHRRSAGLCRTLGHRFLEATVLVDLGEAYLAGGDRAAARLHWQYALLAFERLGHPAAAQVRASLAKLDESATGVPPVC